MPRSPRRPSRGLDPLSEIFEKLLRTDALENSSAHQRYRDKQQARNADDNNSESNQ
jgi:hypothetical protein